MARIRSIPPDAATDPKLCAVSLAASALAKESWPWHDDHGHISYEPERIRLCVWPSRQIDIGPLLDELIAVGWFEVYVLPGGRRFLFCTEFLTYQKVPHPSAPKFDRRSAKKWSAEAEESAALMSPHEPSGGLSVDGMGSGEEGMSEGTEKPSASAAREAARDDDEFVQQFPETHREDVRCLLLRHPGRADSWKRSIDARLTGLHPPTVPVALMAEAVRQFNTNGGSNWAAFEGYVRRLMSGSDPPAPRSSRNNGHPRRGGVAARTFANGLEALKNR